MRFLFHKKKKKKEKKIERQRNGERRRRIREDLERKRVLIMVNEEERYVFCENEEAMIEMINKGWRRKRVRKKDKQSHKSEATDTMTLQLQQGWFQK